MLSWQLAARADQIIYDDSLESGWANWSWATVNLTNISPVHSGADSISVSCTNYGALYLHHDAFAPGGTTNLTFWINGGNGGQPIKVQATTNGVAPNVSYSFTAVNQAWEQIVIPLSALGITTQTNMDGFWIQGNSSAQLNTFYIDDIALVTNIVSTGTNATVTININAQANRNPISAMIYGVAFASSNELTDLNFTMNRSGGNNETRYNWQLNCHNLDFDYYFESYPDSSAVPGATADAFVANSKAAGAQPMITIPMIGWAPFLGPGRGKLYSYSVAKYGPQTSIDPYLTDAGNGISVTNNTHITWNDPTDANFPTNVLFEQGYVQHLMSNWGSSTNGGVRYYVMDNEHSIWFSTHQDIHPVGPTMQEIWSKMLATASMVKSNDPNALVIGPEEWGWPGYLYSGYDQQWSGQRGDYNPTDYPDRAANGGWDYIPWLLNQFHQYALTNNNQRLLDYLTVHCYPQENNVSGDAVDTATELLRNQSTRVFWDTNYVDPSWINSIIMLVPRLKNWAATYYPGTKTGVTEYNWGAEASINGATAQADILGIFGREGLDLATRWTTPANTTPTYLAMKMYRNYDGNKSTFGDTSIQTATPNPDVLSAYAAVRSSDGAMTLMAINKDITNATPITANITNFLALGTAQRWQLTSANTINQLSNVTLTNGVLSDMLPAQSITLYVLPGVAPFNLHVVPGNTTGQLTLSFGGQTGLTYIVQSSTNLSHWTGVSTNTLVSNSFPFVVNETNSASYFRSLLVMP
ncbi:MAG TPA: glycoside hydrolase family 44 protein [Verrucomicrobiae bacterium]|jgi:hypothetical protein